MAEINPDPYSAQWAATPEPNPHELDPRVILEQPSEGADCWMWDSFNETTAWLQYDGPLAGIEQ